MKKKRRCQVWILPPIFSSQPEWLEEGGGRGLEVEVGVGGEGEEGGRRVWRCRVWGGTVKGGEGREPGIGSTGSGRRCHTAGGGGVERHRGEEGGWRWARGEAGEGGGGRGRVARAFSSNSSQQLRQRLHGPRAQRRAGDACWLYERREQMERERGGCVSRCFRVDVALLCNASCRCSGCCRTGQSVSLRPCACGPLPRPAPSPAVVLSLTNRPPWPRSAAPAWRQRPSSQPQVQSQP